MSRKFLDDLGVEYPEKWVTAEDERQPAWAAERKVYGFDSRDTWSLNTVMLQLLFERLSLYFEKADERVDLTYRTFEWEGRTATQRELILELLEECKQALKDDSEELPADFTQNIWRKWALIEPAMWW